MTFLDVVNPVLAKCANDSARRALVVRLLAVLGHEAAPEVWRLKWEGRAQVTYSWMGSPAGDLWLAGGRMHVGLVPKGEDLVAPDPAPPLPPPSAYEDDLDVLIRTDPKALAKLRKIMTPFLPALEDVPPILIPKALEEQAFFLMRRIVEASEMPRDGDVEDVGFVDA